MTPKTPYRLIQIEPNVVSDLQMLLVQAGEVSLAAQVEQLSVVEQADHAHGSDFYMVPRSKGRWGPNHRTLGLQPGALHIDVVNDQIVCIEVLRRRSELRQATPDNS